MNPKRVTYKKWAGISLVSSGAQGEYNLYPGSSHSHLTKAMWLTAAIETGGKFGTVQSYDGAGISAGLEHKIAILPKSMEQGPLWKLLGKLPEEPGVLALKNALHAEGWYIDPRGDLRLQSSGALVRAEDIRNTFAPPNGVVPVSGPHYDEAVRWARLWSAAFSEIGTMNTQTQEAKKSLLLSHKDIESKVYKKYASLDDASAATSNNISQTLDLAMCIYHSFSVNAPTRARKVLQEVFDMNLSESDFSKTLVNKLGTNTFANWKQRYTRTAAKVKSSNLWSQATMDAVLI